MIKKVDFFIIGAQKAATTSLYNYLNEHPDIYLPEVKENRFFVDEKVYKEDVSQFHQYYETYNNQQLAGGAYVHMLTSKETPERVYRYNKNAKFLVMLRNPVDRAYSAYNFAIGNGWESKSVSFAEAFKLEEKRQSGSYKERTELSYFSGGLYFKHLSNWLKWFDQSRFLVLLDSDFVENGKAEIAKVFEFLGVAHYDHINTQQAYNKSFDVKVRFIHHVLRNKESRLRASLSKYLPFGVKTFYRRHILKPIDRMNKVEKKYIPLSATEKAMLFKYYEDDMKALSCLINRDVYNLWKPFR